MRVWAEKEECGIFIWQMDKSMQTNQSIQRRAGAHFHSPGLNHSHESSRPVWQRQSFVIWFAHQPDVDADAQAAREPDDRDGRQSVSQDVRTSGHQDIRKPGSQGVRVRTSRALRDPRDEHCNFPAPVDGHRTSLTVGVVHFRRLQFKGRVA